MAELYEAQFEIYDRIERKRRNYKKDSVKRKTYAYLNIKIANINDDWNEFKANHKKIIGLKDRVTNEKSQKYGEEDVYLTVEELVAEFKSELEDDRDVRFPESSKNGTTATDNKNSENQAPITKVKDEVKLPRINLPRFAGDYRSWTSFHDLYLSLIHNNSSLSQVQKLHYLKGSVTGEAEQLLRNFSTTEANYSSAWQTLVDRYENRKVLINAELQTLFNQPRIHSESASKIRQLLDTTLEALQSIKNLKIDTSTWDVMINYLVVERLPGETRKLWENSIGSSRDPATLHDLKIFMEGRFRALEAYGDEQKRPAERTKKQTFHVTTNQVCVVCGNADHNIRYCPSFKAMDPDIKQNLVHQKGLCINCLGHGHLSAQCPSRSTCFHCKKKHHTLLHKRLLNANAAAYAPARQTSLISTTNETQAPLSSPIQSSLPQMSSFHARSGRPQSQVLLATALVKAVGPNGMEMIVRALIDPGSQATFITENVAQKLCLKRKPITAHVTGLGNFEASTSAAQTVFDILPIKGHETLKIKALILRKITDLLPGTRIEKSNWEHISGLRLADPTFNTPGKIDVLLGAEVYCNILLEGIRRGPRGTPIAQNTTLGWVICGEAAERELQRATNVITLYNKLELENQIRAFWELEEVEKNNTSSPEEKKCETIYEETTRRLQNGTYMVHLPFKTDHVNLGRSREVAYRRFNFLEKKLRTNPEDHKNYAQVLEEYSTLDHMRPAVKTENELSYINKIGNEESSCSYLPHHAVWKESSTTTKLRVVFDASCKTSNGHSLNDQLLVGPKIQDDLITLLMRWRKFPIVFTADVEKMYRQIRMADHHAQYQRILWRPSPEHEISDYCLHTVTFGTASAPFLAIRTLQQLAKDERTTYPIGAESVLNDFYVDDLLSGEYSLVNAKNKQRQIINLLKSGGFMLRKWSSNIDELLEDIAPEHRESSRQKLLDVPEVIKTLGMRWSPTTDDFTFKLNEIHESGQGYTKRNVLSEISKLFDPMGLLAPIIIKAKVLIQSLWLIGTEWDEELPKNSTEIWKQFAENLKYVESITIPRWIHSEKNSTWELHGFCDASIQAYAAAVYARITSENGLVHAHLLIAKTKVAPIKQVSLPRLELCGAVLLAKLLSNVKTNLKLDPVATYTWTDSTIVLAWLQKPPIQWTTFVANRVSEINSKLQNNKWRYVPSKDNPADCATRGTTPQELKQHDLWWHGPSWLRQQEMEWPSLPQVKTEFEQRKVKSLLAIKSSESMWSDIISRYSSLSKLLRISAYCFRFISSCLGKRPQTQFVSSGEITSALRFWIKFTQECSFPTECRDLKTNGNVGKKSRLASLNAFIDQDGILRVGGRLQKADIPESEKHPIIIPHNQHLTDLLIREMHHKTLHGGTQLMLGLLRQKYWIINARNAVKRHIHNCVLCFRYKSKAREQLMGQLPAVRVRMSRPFTNIGIDYCGPFELRISSGRNIRKSKGYIAIFICLAVRAIHIEVVSDMSTQTFLAAFKRFTSRRGLCSNVYTDCGTNFVGAKRILNEDFEDCRHQTNQHIAQLVANDNIKWHFIPPASPHFGGLWEAGVKSIKHHLRRILNDRTLTFEEMTTLTTQIEACLNSRPICPLTDDPSDLNALTPGHFLIGQALLSTPEPSYLDMNINRLDRWQFLQHLLQSFWKRWHNEYLLRLQQRPKWMQRSKNLRNGDLVLIRDERLPPSRWLLGRVVDTHAGDDDLVRVVTVRTKDSLCKRPIAKLSILPIDQNNPPSISEGI